MVLCALYGCRVPYFQTKCHIVMAMTPIPSPLYSPPQPQSKCCPDQALPLLSCQHHHHHRLSKDKLATGLLLLTRNIAGSTNSCASNIVKTPGLELILVPIQSFLPSSFPCQLPLFSLFLSTPILLYFLSCSASCDCLSPGCPFELQVE